ncbi:MAG: response regulator transcription factor [Erysipelotrichaceae bacterium]|jgi:two-component system alkaline phosphatase synthesis response regulator PhoP|uniref:Response regulator transcription factor n=1 Tax=Grylomicrobium aquisgranensis TaxID=2926318 RepID=A0AB35U0L9_9FIRM|nr:response regulator transcription factor [Lactimicrobium massiliense]MCH4020315.1 response regulator transcription factor [Erysipelotrichaceae bacterium]MCI1326656.1 response regulator transcription factor [Solobacterium sp.]MDD6366200.1 response regulator transcription factor [Stecheria intestinalis]MDX8418608.1 response regulator transcription factor [Stecheria sp. CLA-KB-P133]MCH4044690.1 response regulator transcription factor [Erysipelotrichaceae bacterium]
MMIYCVEDDASIREIEIYTLKSTGFAAKGFETAADFFAALRNEKPDLILLDIMLPDEDGTQVLKKLKKDPVTRDIPVIMASAKGTEYDKVQGLDTGADDYLAKPFGMMEMVSRIRAVLRRVNSSSEQVVENSGIRMDASRHEVLVDGEPVVLTLKEYDLLYLLLSHPGIVYTRDQLLNHIWGTEYDGETRTVDVHVRTLRQKLGNAGRHIDTVRGVGYRYKEDA